MDKNGNTEKNKRGMPLRVMNVLLILLVIVVSIVLFFDVIRTKNSYEDFRLSTERYLSSEQDANALKKGSDYLTEQVRLFAVTGERQYLDNYFIEAKETRSRDKALENFKRYLDGTEEYEYLNKALEYSNKLMEQEYCSMKLRALSLGMDMSDLPAEVAAAEVGKQYENVDSDSQRDRAISIVFSDLYGSYKDRINESIAKSIDKLTEKNREDQIVRSNELFSNLRLQSVLIVVAFLIVLGMMILTARLVILPMTQALRYISNDKKIPIRGSDEMRVLAQTYNEMYDHNAQKKMELSYAANHDGLTGLYNRTAYLRALTESDWNNVAVLAIDVDSFKQINDTHGHAVGDAVLVSVAKALLSEFRSDDFICRIGGDEFTVVMKNVGKDMKELIKKRIERTMDHVAHPTVEAAVPVSLSVGVAFGDWGSQAEKTANRADVALYKVKNAGKNGLAFYDEIGEDEE